MSKKFLTNIDLNKNELQNAVIHKLATAPASPVEGQIYLNTAEGRFYIRIAGEWIDVTGSLEAITSTTPAITIADGGDGTMSIDIANASGTNPGLLSSALWTLLSGATSDATAGTLVARDANGNLSVSEPTAASHAATKAYVDGMVTSGIAIQGTLDGSASPNYPAVDSSGIAFHVSVAGRVGGPSGPLVEVGDLVLSIQASAGGTHAAVGGDFLILQSNTDAATQTTRGTIRIATTDEINAGTSTDTAVTPSALAAYVDANAAGGKFASSVGDGTATSIAVVHGLATTDVVVQLRENATGEMVETDVAITDANTVTLSFAVAPATNAYRVVIKG